MLCGVLTTAWIPDVKVQIHGTDRFAKGSASRRTWVATIIKIYQQINPFTKSQELFGLDELNVDLPCLNAPAVISLNDVLPGLPGGLGLLDIFELNLLLFKIFTFFLLIIAQ